MTEHLYERFYPAEKFEGGTLPFFRMCQREIGRGAAILEIGAGPANPSSEMLAQIGEVTGLDIDAEVQTNQHLARSICYDGVTIPLPNASFDACCSDFALEHIADPKAHFNEVARVLRPGGVYCLRTPNLLHYISLGSRLVPHRVHLLLANRMRGMDAAAHAPYPTFYRSNTRKRLAEFCASAGMKITFWAMIEPETSYGRAHPALFYPMMVYERLVNSSEVFARFRATILMAATRL